MNKVAIILVLLLAVTFVPMSSGKGKVISIVDPYLNEGRIAFLVNDKEPDKEEKPDDGAKCSCGGSGIMVHGDGHKTPCICKATGQCKCQKPNTSPAVVDQPIQKKGFNRKVFLFFTAGWCPPCNQFKRQLPNLVRKGMSYSYIDDNLDTKMEIIDIDQNPELYIAFRKDKESIPFFILLDKDNNEVAYLEGYQDYGDIIRKWNEY